MLEKILRTLRLTLTKIRLLLRHTSEGFNGSREPRIVISVVSYIISVIQEINAGTTFTHLGMGVLHGLL